MGYYIDLEKIGIDQYREKLKTAWLPPSRQMLKDQIDQRFEFFKSQGMDHVQQLLDALKKKDKFNKWAEAECLNEEYLTLLQREIRSMWPKPNSLVDFSQISPETISRLQELGITNTTKLYDRVLTPKLRKQLAETAGINEKELLELACLSDLSRIKWVGVTFAQMLHNLGIHSVEKAAQANPEELHDLINQLNRERNIFKGNIGLNDLRIFVQAAGELPVEMEF